MDELLQEFLTETNEGLGYLDVELVKLEQNPNDPDILSNIFRLMHTIKGTCGFLGLPRLEAVAHAGENVLGKVRDGDVEVSAALVSIVLECLDRIRSILSALEETEAEPAGDDSELIARLETVAEGWDAEQLAQPVTVEDLETGSDMPSDEMPAEEPVEVTDGESPMAEELSEDADEENPRTDEAAENVVEMARPSEAVPSAAQEPAADSAPPEVADKDGGENSQHRESSVANQSIRVNVELLENLMTMVSELVLNRNQLLQILRTHKDSDFAAPLQRLNHVVSELQEGVMKTRMQPIGNAWAKLPRIVRDLSQDMHKKIDLQMKGADTELDRQVLELIKDPLTHMVRNSADHGLETTEGRRAVGKPETGTIVLNAFHEGGHIIIQISDDGRGLNTDKIKEKALANGLTTEAELANMNEQQIMQFIFKPGFSTAQEVTAVSGRGVGMDVVRSNIEKIGGNVELTSKYGKGTSFTIKIPLTLAIVSALIVESASERFAIPQLAVIELVRASANSDHSIERINDTPVLRLRNRLLPLVNLSELLKLEREEDANEKDQFIVVAKVGTYTFGIIVDRVFDTEEIVVKPVAPILRNITLFSGNTILGDGSVVMILDPNGIAGETGELTVTEGMEEMSKQKAAKTDESVAMLLFKAGSEAPKAVPLGLVARLEEIDRESIETSGSQPVVQYRGQLMPLITMDPHQSLEGTGRQPVLVFTDRNRSMGLVVDSILDIVEEPLKIELGGEYEGYIGSATIAGKATDIIDTGYFLTKAYSDWFHVDSKVESSSSASRILLVDDSPFFRNLLSPLLSSAGYHVTTVEGADAALELCEAGEDFDLILSDIEMPGMSGFEFAEAVRANRWSETPLVALSGHASPNDFARGRAAGFSDYVTKFDRAGLLASLNETLSSMRGAA